MASIQTPQDPIRDKLSSSPFNQNIFDAIGIRNAGDQEIKARLVFGLAKLIEAKGLTKTAAADLMGIARPDLSKVLRGKLRVSLERLLNLVRALGSDVEQAHSSSASQSPRMTAAAMIATSPASQAAMSAKGS